MLCQHFEHVRYLPDNQRKATGLIYPVPVTPFPPSPMNLEILKVFPSGYVHRYIYTFSSYADLFCNERLEILAPDRKRMIDCICSESLVPVEYVAWIYQVENSKS